MNYGYNSQYEGWKENKKVLLGTHLNRLIKKLDLSEPYIEIDNLYDGVRIRKITNLTDKQHEKLIEEADKIYEQIMLAKQIL